MKRKLTACLFTLILLVLLPVTVWAQETTLTTMIPTTHILHIDIVGDGEIVVDGVSYTQSGDLQIPRGATPQISVKPTDGAVLKSAIVNEKDITEELCKGAYTLPEMFFDARLVVAFETVPGAPKTGDPAPVSALCLAMLLSLAGVLYSWKFPGNKKV